MVRMGLLNVASFWKELEWFVVCIGVEAAAIVDKGVMCLETCHVYKEINKKLFQQIQWRSDFHGEKCVHELLE